MNIVNVCANLFNLLIVKISPKRSHVIHNNTNYVRALKCTLHTLREFKMSLNDVQQDIFENNIMRMEKEKDGRVFKFDNLKDGTVGIFEKINHPLAKSWVVLFQAPKEKGTWCFDELNKIYRHIRMARLIDKAEK